MQALCLNVQPLEKKDRENAPQTTDELFDLLADGGDDEELFGDELELDADSDFDDDEDNDDGYYYILDNEDVVEQLNACASVFNAMNSMRGFHLDRAWNMIGTTGWDVLRDAIMGEDMIKATLNRYR